MRVGHVAKLSMYVILSVLFPSGGQAETIDSLRTKIANNLSTIGSIEVRYHTPPVDLNEPAFRDLKRIKLKKPQESQRAIWAKQGDREFYELSPWYDAFSDSYQRRLFMYDGRQFFQFYFNGENAEDAGVHWIVNEVQVRDKLEVNDFVEHSVPARMLGIHVRGTQLTLLELLQRPTVTYVGDELVDGQSCHRIDFGQYEGFTDYHYRLVVWFDSQRDYLPRKLEATPVFDQKQNLRLATAITFRESVREFFEVDDPVLGRRRWFPRTVLQGAAMIYEMDEVRVNLQIPATFFQPTLPPGTQVRYLDQRVPLPGTNRTNIRTVRSGGAEGAEIAKKSAEENAIRQRDAQLEKNRIEALSRGNQRLLVAAGVTVLIAVAAVLVWKRSKRRFR